MAQSKRQWSFPLRLPHPMRIQATELAHRDGISLNQFIVQAIAEGHAAGEFPLVYKPTEARSAENLGCSSGRKLGH